MAKAAVCSENRIEHKNTLRMYNEDFWMLNLVMRKVTARFQNVNTSNIFKLRLLNKNH